MKELKILFFGDVVGRAGRRGLIQKLPDYKAKYEPDLVVANVENLAHGYGITEKTLNELKSAGCDFFTSGNHIWKKKEGWKILAEKDPLVLRPQNYPNANPGTGYKIVKAGAYHILIINLMGRVFMQENLACPFLLLDEVLEKTATETFHGILVDFHAEATSEKKAFFHYVDNRVSAALGTHTHVPTADASISDTGTASITDVGMCGPKDSVIGHKKGQIIERFVTQRAINHEVEEEGPALVNGIFLAIHPETRQALSIEPIHDEVA